MNMEQKKFWVRMFQGCLIAFGASFFAALGLAYYYLGVAASVPNINSGAVHRLVFSGSIVYLNASQHRFLDILEGMQVACMGLAALSFFGIRQTRTK